MAGAAAKTRQPQNAMAAQDLHRDAEDHCGPPCLEMTDAHQNDPKAGLTFSAGPCADAP
jgi:hypothetical protein